MISCLMLLRDVCCSLALTLSLFPLSFLISCISWVFFHFLSLPWEKVRETQSLQIQLQNNTHPLMKKHRENIFWWKNLFLTVLDFCFQCFLLTVNKPLFILNDIRPNALFLSVDYDENKVAWNEDYNKLLRGRQEFECFYYPVFLWSHR